MSKFYLPQLFVTIVLLSGLFAAQSSFALTYDPRVPLTASDGSGNDFFGHAVSYSGETVVVGAPGENALYVYDRDTNTDIWSQTKKITTGGSDQLGTTVGISGDIIVSSDVDTVYVFERTFGGANAWGLRESLSVPTVTSVAVSGDAAAVGADSLLILQKDQGGANNWGMIANPALSSTASAVSLSGDTAVVGIVGSAFVHEKDQGGANNWGQAKTLSQLVGFFGHSVSISGNSIVVGGPTLIGNGIPYVFDRNQGGANNWGLVTSIPGGSGQSVSISGDTIISGDAESDEVFVHDRNQGGANNWGLVTSFNGIGPDDAFGFSVYQSESNNIVIGAPLTSGVEGSVTVIPVNSPIDVGFGDFACWELNPLHLPSLKLFNIQDQFGITENDVWVEKQYCAAAEKQFNGDQFDSPFAPGFDQHYQGFIYPPDFPGAGTGQTVILDVPQFGHTFQTTLGFADSILVPTAKELPPGGIFIDSQDNEQHWNCYEISEDFSAGPVDLNTQHGDMFAAIGEAFLMCAPMIKTDVQAQQQFGALFDEHMVCYDLIPTQDNSDNLPIALANQLSNFQFAPIQIDGVEKFCAPAFKSFPSVGGSDVSINTSALLLAGVQSVSMWMIPVILSGIGISVFVIKRRN